MIRTHLFIVVIIISFRRELYDRDTKIRKTKRYELCDPRIYTSKIDCRYYFMKCGVCCGVVGGVYCGAIGLYNLVEPKRLVVVNTSMSMSN